MQSVMLACFHSVQGKLQHRLGFSDLLGFDFMVDEHLRVLAGRAPHREGGGVTCHADPWGLHTGVVD